MNTSKIKAYAPKARNDFIRAVTQRANRFGIFGDHHIEEISFKGDVAMIGDRAVTRKEGELREKLVQRVRSRGFDMMIRSMAYTWFNRFVALRYMELHDYLGHGMRVLSHPNGSDVPEILSRAADVDLPGLDKDKALELRLAGNRDNELYRMLIVAQCNALHQAMPFLFEPIDSETELLLPDNLLHSDSPIRKLVTELDESLWQDVEIIGWIYQFYISEKKSEVIGKTVKSEDIPAATQLFTPNWIVKYMVQNTLGRMWLANYPDSPLRDKMDYYIEPAEQEPEVQQQLDAITPDALNPEEITFMDPACGSGHILVEAYDIFKQIYQERGYRTRDIPGLILKDNLYGLEIDDRAAQLAGFAVLMRARADDRNIFSRNNTPLNIMSIQPFAKTDPGNIDLFFRGEDYAQIRQDLKELVTLFENAKTFGSLITIPADHLVEELDALQKAVDEKIGTGFKISGAQNLVTLVQQAKMLAKKYDCVVTNPPYMGKKGMNLVLKDFAKRYYPDSKSDLFAMFIEKGCSLAKQARYASLVTMQSWMFLSSLESFRKKIIENQTISCLLHMANGVMGIAFGTSATVWMNTKIRNHAAHFSHVRFEDINDKGFPVEFPIGNERLILANPDEFWKIPGSPIAYWVSDKFRLIFLNCSKFKDLTNSIQGIITGNTDKFLKMWAEVSFKKISKNYQKISEINIDRFYWIPYTKGGQYRKWYGNYETLINWKNEGSDLVRARTTNRHFYLKPCLTWNLITSGKYSARYCPEGFLWDVSSSIAFPKENENVFELLALLCSNSIIQILDTINPTVNTNIENIESIPVCKNSSFGYSNSKVEKIARRALMIAREDWNSYEISWEFEIIQLLRPEYRAQTIKKAYTAMRSAWSETTDELCRLEEKNNRIFIEAYGLEDELTPDVPLEEITLTCNPYYRYGGNKSEGELEARLQTDTIKELISYAIGCMMGRYSLDEPGLIYAHEENIGFAPERYKTFPADDDAIIPVMDRDWFEDDATHRFVEFIKTAWPEDHLEENLKFVAESLGPKNNEAHVETIRRYISTSFFKDHLRMYKKRPIYWLFSSGKHKAFECLVYLHRYNESTLSRMRSLYVTPLQGNFSARMEYLKNEYAAAPSASAKKKIEKEQDLLAKKQKELAAFDDQLRHLADQKITLDLDDGVKVNYSKFGNLLGEKKAVTGEK